MKKKILSLLLVCCLIVPVLFGLSGCKKESAPTSFKIEVQECDNGLISVSKSMAEGGETISVKAFADSGYYLKAITYNDILIEDNEFVMPSENVVIKALFSQQNIVNAETIKPKLGSYVCINWGDSEATWYNHQDSTFIFNTVKFKENNKVDIITKPSEAYQELENLDYVQIGNVITITLGDVSAKVDVIDDETILVCYDGGDDKYYLTFVYKENFEIATGKYHLHIEKIEQNIEINLQANNNITLKFYDVQSSDPSREEAGTYKIIGNRIYITSNNGNSYMGILSSSGSETEIMLGYLYHIDSEGTMNLLTESSSGGSYYTSLLRIEE